MQREEIISKLKEIVSPYAQNKAALDSVSEETDFITDLKINSANLVDVILDVEEEFDIVIDNDAMETMLNVKASIDVIELKLSQK
ncbi:MAG: acyl carrier protein [Pedobacter sp.]|nr:MAG: acyl carrier protein [Pedobacter sp.]